MKKTLLTGIAALFLATGTAHADPKGIPPHECPTVFTRDGLQNRIEVNACRYKWNVFVANHPEKKGDWLWSWYPPAEYDIPFTGVLMLQRLPIDQVHDICGSNMLACTIPFKQKTFNGNSLCLIIMLPDDIIRQVSHLPQNPKDVLRHETGHCNGWPPDHSGSLSQGKWEWVEK